LNESELLESAKKVLDGNWTGNFTIPSGTLYPHQWSWDSCMIAIGNSYFDTDRSMKELEHLFDAQWKNGMIPHIVFNEKEKTYFPSPEYYDITRSPNAPNHVKTSGMTQPPVHALACLSIRSILEAIAVQPAEGETEERWIYFFRCINRRTEYFRIAQSCSKR
jgi:hypothetical protein